MNKLIKLAYEICASAHAGQTDKMSLPYHLHPERVAARCTTDAETIVALLHDTIEDTDITPEYLLDKGFPQEIVDAVLSVTKRDGESYEDFVARAKQNPIGRMVKIHDLEDNMDLRRLNELTDEMVSRQRKYLKAYHFLKSDKVEEVIPAGIKQPLRTLDDYYRDKREDANRHFRSQHYDRSKGTAYMHEKLMIHLPDKSIVDDKFTIDSFIKFIAAVGYNRVEELGIMYEKQPLVSYTMPERSQNYKRADKGWWALSNCPTVLIGQYVNEIAERLNLRAYAELALK